MSEPRPRRIDGWSAFFGWAFVGALLAFALAAALSVGGLALPFVLLLGGMMIWARPPAHSLLGLIAGVGALILLIGVINIGSTPCPEQGTIVFEGDFSCGGFNATPWLIVGATSLALGTALFAVAERRAAEPDVEQTTS